MRALSLVIVALLLAACAAATNAPSLAPRPAEAIDPRVPVPEVIVSKDVSVGLLSQLNALLSQATAGDAVFLPLAEHARQLSDSAGARESESWVVAQQALSAAVAARAPVAKAVADVDAIGSQRIQATGGISHADLKALDDASAKISGIDSRETALIAQVQARLAR